MKPHEQAPGENEVPPTAVDGGIAVTVPTSGDRGPTSTPRDDASLAVQPATSPSTAPEASLAGIVVIGASAGGLRSLQIILGALRPDFPWPVLVAMHVDARHPSHLAEVLEKATPLAVRQASAGEVLLPGHVYIGPSDREMGLNGQGAVVLRAIPEGKPERIDFLLDSASVVLGERVVAVVVSGTGSDGAAGCLSVKKRGGTVVVESEASAQHFGMPNAVITAGAADLVRSAAEIASVLVELAVHGGAPTVPDDREDLHRILGMLKARRGTSFNEYRLPTLRRRIHKRMLAVGVATFGDYGRVLEAEPSEIDELFDALLINVTEFFRDPDAWDALRVTVIPDLVARRREGREIRVWCAGCATGEEAYSVAMLIAEALPDTSDWNSVKVFATDIDDDALATARSGRYPASRFVNVGADRLARFFRPVGVQHYEVMKPLRRMVVFGRHDLTRDPPIGRLDLVICRNVLIYFDIPLQRRILEVIGYSLEPDAFLLLGRSESLLRDSTGWTTIDRPLRLFKRTGRDGATRERVPNFGPPRIAPATEALEAPATPASAALSPGSLAQVSAFVRDAAPFALVVVGAGLEIRYANPFALATLGGGRHPALGDKLSDAFPILRGTVIVEGLERALATGRRARLDVVKLSQSGRNIFLDATIDVVRDETGATLALLTGHDVTGREEVREALRERTAQLQEAVEEVQTTNEELQSANEELVTANEELQSSNEELATVNEELQSTNEELETTNEELQSTNAELGATNAELQRSAADYADLASIHRTVADVMSSGIVVCDEAGVVVLWNPRAREFFGRHADEVVGRNVFSLDLLFETGILRDLVAQALSDEDPHASTDVEVRSLAGGRKLHLSVHRLPKGHDIVKGWVLVCDDITREQRALTERDTARAMYDALLGRTRESVVVLDPAGHIERATATAIALLGAPEKDASGRFLWDFIPDAADALKVKGAVADLMRPNAKPRVIDLRVTVGDGHDVTMTFVPVGVPLTPPVVILSPHTRG